MTVELTLGDLGERRILREIVPRYAVAAGDDCAALGTLSGNVVITTDPVPPPAAKLLGGDPDLYWMGWLLVTISASDIAASGARPKAFVAALEMPATLSIRNFERLLEGIRDSCTRNGLDYVGGNLREAERIGGVGTAIGASKVPPLTRKGARKDDSLVVIGEAGRFWADAERIRRGIAVDKAVSPIFSPVSQATVIHRLHEANLLACAMDTSDGLAPTLVELATTNDLGLDIQINTMATNYRDLADRPERFWMGWGDWTVVAAVRPQHTADLMNLLSNLDVPATIIGSFVKTHYEVRLYTASASVPLGRLESERFAADSWFAAGVERYRDLLYDLPLPPR